MLAPLLRDAQSTVPRRSAGPPLLQGSHLRLSQRDRHILALTARKLAGARVDFGEALRALREAVEESIPAGRTYLLGLGEQGPVIGSVISGVGLCERDGAVLVVRVGRDGRRTSLGALGP